MRLQFLVIYFILLFILLYKCKVQFKNQKIEVAFNNLNNLRGLFAILIILSHFVQRLNSIPAVLFPIHKISTICVSFFFLMSGYGLVYQFLNKKDYMKSFLIKKYLNIVVVLIGFLISFYFFKTVGLLLYGYTFTYVPINWYIIEISLLYLLFYFCYNYFYNSRKKRVIAISLLVVIQMIVFFLIGSSRMYFICEFPFVLGMIISEYSKEFNNIYRKKRNVYLLFLLDVIFVIISASAFFIKEYTVLDLILHNLLGKSVLLIFIKFSLYFNYNNKILLFLKRISFEIYIYQFPLLYFSAILYENKIIDYNLLCMILFVIVDIIIAYFANHYNQKILKCIRFKIESKEDNKMKIAIIGHKRIPSNEGGIEKGVEQHATRMVQRGHKVTAYNRGGHNVFGKEHDQKKIKEYKGIKIVTIPTTSGNSCVPIYSFLATLHCIFHRPDVISFRASGPCAMIPLAKLFGIKCVASLHGIDSQRDKWGGFASKYLRFGEKMAATKADVCLVLSQNMKEYIKKTYNRDSVLFANGIDKQKNIKPSIIKDKFGLSKDSYLLSLGRIVPEKGLHYLIEAFRKCKTNKKLIIAGGSESNSEYYNELVKMANGDERIQFIGFVQGETIAELYSNAYLFLLPSNLEGMANALLEAMSYGNCCLVSDIPENTEVVEEKAVVFKKGNVEDLFGKLQGLLDNSKKVTEYKRHSSRFILDKYNWDKIVTQMLEIYSGNVIEYSEVDKVIGDK